MEVSFSDRLHNIMAMQNFLSTHRLDAQLEAKRLEESAHQQAKSKEDYQELCDSIIGKLQAPEAQPSNATRDESEDPTQLDMNGPNVGKYEHATIHRDGQMSTIFKAEATASSSELELSGKVVALKITTPSMMTAPHNSERESRILREACHDDVIPLLEIFWQPGGRLVLVFPFMPYDLETLLRHDSLSQNQSQEIIRSLFRALAHIHSLGIIHRDVKPSNILLQSRNGPVYLADFGIAWSSNDRDSEPAAKKITDVGTTSYRPPELLFGHKGYDSSLDIWAAGCVVGDIMRSDHQALFDAGPLGSELGLIKSMFSTLGTPNDSIWPSAKTYPDWGKMRFYEYPAKPWAEILSGASTTAIDFVSQTVRYESTKRLTAEKALAHDFLTEG